MKHTLCSKFQGSWLGSILGEVLADLQLKRSPQLEMLQEKPPAWLEDRNSLALDLIKSPDFGVESVLIRHKLQFYSSSDLALLLLPLILFYVDDFAQLPAIVIPKQKQQSNSQEKLTNGHGHLTHLRFPQMTENNFYDPKTSENIQEALIWGNAIILALQAKLEVNNFIESILLDTEINFTPLMQQLKIVKNALKIGKPSNKVVEELSRIDTSSNALALSLYCFGVAPEDFELSVNLAISNKYRTQKVAALTGALSGAYNGFMGIPLKSRAILSQNPIYPSTTNIIIKLFSVWSGTYREMQDNSLLTLVAAPGSLQTRSLKIISQTK